MSEKYAGGFATDFQDPRGLGGRKADGGVLTPLERMPHVIKKIQETWGKKELNVFVQSILMDSRDGKRQGLPPEAGQDLVMLAEINTIGRALVMARRINIPFSEAMRKIEAELEVDAGNPFADPMASRETARYSKRLDSRDGSQERASARREAQEGSGTRLMGFIMGLVLNRYVLMLIVALIVARMLWPQLFK